MLTASLLLSLIVLCVATVLSTLRPRPTADPFLVLMDRLAQMPCARHPLVWIEMPFRLLAVRLRLLSLIEP